MADPAAFAQWLKRRRLELDLSQRAVDAQIGLGTGWTSRFERGDIQTPPGKETCGRLASVLRVDREEVWKEAAPERLRSLDPDLWEWHRSQRTRQSGNGQVPDAILELVEEVLEFDSLDGDEESIADALSMLLASLSTHARTGDADEMATVRRVTTALRRLQELPLDAELQVLGLVATQIELALSLIASGARTGRGQ